MRELSEHQKHYIGQLHRTLRLIKMCANNELTEHDQMVSVLTSVEMITTLVQCLEEYMKDDGE